MQPTEKRADERPRDDVDGGKLPRRPPKMVRNRRGARVRLDGRDHYLGRWGSKEAKVRYGELIAQWVANDGRMPLFEKPDPVGATIDEVITLYRDNELPTRPPSVRQRIKVALRTELLGQGLTRGMVNVKLRMIRDLFAWGATIGRVPEGVPFRLAAVKSLRRGQGTRESRIVQPVEWETVDATLKHATEPVRGLILYQWHTGARPGEACDRRSASLPSTWSNARALPSPTGNELCDGGTLDQAASKPRSAAPCRSCAGR
ncbi:MAG: hypothetical protein R3F56_06960 [Planctomycetota bacterium]